MRKSSLVIFASLLCLGALPAAAAVHQSGAVNVSADHYTHVTWTDFDGPVARLSFIPANDTVDCDHITINYMDGTSHDVFSGTLMANQKETITFPDRDSRLSSVNFSCKALTRDGARMDISAVTDGDMAYNDLADRPANVTTHTDVYIR